MINARDRLDVMMVLITGICNLIQQKARCATFTTNNLSTFGSETNNVAHELAQGRWLNRPPDVGSKLAKEVARWGVAADNVLRSLREDSACRAAGHSACDLCGALPDDLSEMASSARKVRLVIIVSGSLAHPAVYGVHDAVFASTCGKIFSIIAARAVLELALVGIGLSSGVEGSIPGDGIRAILRPCSVMLSDNLVRESVTSWSNGSGCGGRNSTSRGNLHH